MREATTPDAQPPVEGESRGGETGPADGSRIKVTLSSASVYPRKAPFAFEAAAHLGYDGMEVMVWSDTTTQDAKALAKLSADVGVPIRSVHAPTLLVSQRVWGRLPGPKLEQTVDLALELGAQTVVVHPPFRWQGLYARGFADHVRELNEATGVTVAVENMYPWRGRKREVQAYLPGWDPTDHPYDAVTLDLSHAAVARQNSLDLLDVFGDRLAHVHLADGTDSMKDEHMVPGRGTQPCDKVLGEPRAPRLGGRRRGRDRDPESPHGRRTLRGPRGVPDVRPHLPPAGPARRVRAAARARAPAPRRLVGAGARTRRAARPTPGGPPGRPGPRARPSRPSRPCSARTPRRGSRPR